MAGQGNYKPNFYGRYHNETYEPLPGSNQRQPVYDSQPVFPRDYRQFGNYTPPTSNYGPTDFSRGSGIPMQFAANSGLISQYTSNQIQYGGYPNIALVNNVGDTYSARFPGAQNISDSNEGIRKVHDVLEKPTAFTAVFADKIEARKVTDKCAEFSTEKQTEVNESKSVNTLSTESSLTSESKETDLSNVDCTAEQPTEDTKVVVKEEPPFDDELDESKNDTEDLQDLYDDSTESEDSLSDSNTTATKAKTTKKEKGKAPKLLKAFLPKKPKQYTCEVCGKVMKSLRALEKHRNLHTDNFKCDKCNKIFNSAVSLKNHDKVHSGFKGQENCNVCFKKFYDKSSLNKHTLSVHMGIKNYQCEYCQLSFFARKTYEEHVRVHTGERPFKCDLCPKSYKRISDLNHHLRLHKGETSHTCDKCGEGFRRSSELKRHMGKHSDDGNQNGTEVRIPAKSKTCVFCGLVFSTLKSLNDHISTHMDINGQLLTPELRQGGQNVFEKKRMVNQIVSELDTNLKEQKSVTDKMDDEIRSILHVKKNVTPTLSADNDVFDNTGAMDMVPNTLGLLPSESYSESQNQLNETEKLGTTCRNVGDIFEGQSSVSVTKTVDDEFTIKIQPLQFECDDYDGYDEMEDDYADDVEIEMVNDAEDPDYGGDTDIEDYNYVMNDSELPLDSPPGNDIKDVRKKIKVEKDEYAGAGKESRKKIKVEAEENVDMEKEGKKEDPTYVPPAGNKRKKKLKTPQKKTKRKAKKVSFDESTDDDNSDTVDDFDTNDKGSHDSGKGSENKDSVLDLTCTQCGKQLSNKVTLEKHMNLHLGTFSCELCGKCFSKQKSLDTHMDNHDGKKVNTAKCNVCDKTFYDNSSLNKHVKAVHMDYKPYPCPECDRRFSERKTLTEHLRVHSGERPFACEFCGKTYKRAGELNFHIRKHGGEVKVNCPECDKGFMRMGLLRQHMMMKHDKDRPFRCFYCAKTFPTRAMLKDHKLKHIKERNHVCEKCGSQFYTVSKLKKHMRRKTDCQLKNFCVNGVYVCKFCFQEFSSMDNRKAHIDENHVNEKPPRRSYPCHICGKMFSRPQGLKTHLKIHLNVRDYHCTQCSASFIQKHHLTQHIATHTGEKPYQCSICMKSFAHNATLYNHMKHH